MRVLWTVNIIPEFPAQRIGISPSPTGGWLMSMADSLLSIENDMLLCLVSVGTVSSVSACRDGRKWYYVIPNEKREWKNAWDRIIEDFRPEIVHLQGTEFDFGNYLLEKKSDYKVISSIQGMISEIAKYYYAGISAYDRFINVTFRDLLRLTMRQEKKNFEKRGINEINILKKADYIIGRTDWDRSVCSKYGLENKYRKCNENLRNAFYGAEWDYSRMTKHTIFVSQGAIPYKGVHNAIKALALIKRKYPDARMRIAGYDITQTTHGMGRLKQHGYTKYLSKLIKESNLADSIEYIGLLSEEEMLAEYLKANCFIQSSSIENSPNSLGEALLVGTPAIASFVGGTGNFLKHNENGYAYPFEDVGLLAFYIDLLFTDKDICIRFSNNARAEAKKYYNRINNANTMLNIYKEAIKNS